MLTGAELEAHIEAVADDRFSSWLPEVEEPVGDGADGESPLREAIRRTTDSLEAGLVERGTEARVLLLAVYCGEHVLMMGAPGTAKSLLARRLAKLCGPQATFFERLLTRFSVPEELFGPLSLRALERDEYTRNTGGYLPEATVAFLDEIFKANSAILNTLLSIVNERLFDNGSERVEVPLRCLVAASNEPPESEELDALYDRFLFRLDVQPVSDEGVASLIALAAAPARSESPLVLDFADVDLEREAASAVEVPDDIVAVLRDLRRFAASREPPVPFSDRRLWQAVQMLRVAAHTCGRSKVDRADCLLLRHVIWHDAGERRPLEQWLVNRLAVTTSAQVAAVFSGFLDRMQSDSAVQGDARRELAAFRKALVPQVIRMSLLLRRVAQHCWLEAADAEVLCAQLRVALARQPAGGPAGLLREVARLDAAAELGSLYDYVAGRRSRGELRWQSTAGTGATGADVPVDEQLFTVGKHRGKTFSDVALNDADYCSMVERKVSEGQFAKDNPLDRQIRAFVAYLQESRAKSAS